VKSHLYTEALERLTDSHADLKCRMALLEAENKRLVEEAAVRRKEAENRALQQAMQREAMDSNTGSASSAPLHGAGFSHPSNSSTSGTPRRQRVPPRSAGGQCTPPVQRPMPPWRGQLYKPPAHQVGDYSFGRSTPGARGPPFRAQGGAETVPAGRGTPRAPQSTSLAGGRIAPKIRAPGDDLSRTSRSNSPSRSASPKAQISRPTSPRRREGSVTPPAGRPGKGNSEKDLPPNWKMLAANAYCEDTGRPIADRVSLSDFTCATSKKSESIYWVNARVRWADLRIMERGRVPQRGEDLVLFVLHGMPVGKPAVGKPDRSPSPPRGGSSPRGAHAGLSEAGRTRRSTSPPKVANLPKTWHVGSSRVIRHLPFQDQVAMPTAADAGGAILRHTMGVVFTDLDAVEQVQPDASYSYMPVPYSPRGLVKHQPPAPGAVPQARTARSLSPAARTAVRRRS